MTLTEDFLEWIEEANKIASAPEVIMMNRNTLSKLTGLSGAALDDWISKHAQDGPNGPVIVASELVNLLGTP